MEHLQIDNVKFLERVSCSSLSCLTLLQYLWSSYESINSLGCNIRFGWEYLARLLIHWKFTGFGTVAL